MYIGEDQLRWAVLPAVLVRMAVAELVISPATSVDRNNATPMKGKM